MHTAPLRTWLNGNGHQQDQDYDSYQIGANLHTNHNNQHAVNHTNPKLRQLLGDNEPDGLPHNSASTKTSKLRQLLGEPNEQDFESKDAKTKNPLSKWFSSLTRRKNKSSTRPAVEILFDQENSYDDTDMDVFEGGFVQEQRRKYSDPTGLEKPRYLGFGSLDRRPWMRNEVEQNSVRRRQYGSLDRRAQSQILTRWTGVTAQDLRYDDSWESKHQHYGSSSESETVPVTRWQQQSRFWSLPRRKTREPYTGNNVEPSQLSTVSSLNNEPLARNQGEWTTNIDFSLPRNFKLRKHENGGTSYN